MNQQNSEKRITPLVSVYLARAILALLPLISLPLFLEILGPIKWTQLVLFQTIGAVLSLLVDLAWSIDGHGKIEMDGNLIRDVQIQKNAIFLAIVAIVIPIAIWMEESVSMVSWLGMISVCSMGLSNWWHSLAIGKVRSYILVELLPRTIPSLLLLFVIKYEKQISDYFALMIILNLIFCWRKIDWPNKFSTYIIILSKILPRLQLVLWRVLQSSYFLFALPILSIFNPAACFSYALVERVYRFSMTATLPMQDFLILHPPKGKGFMSTWKSMAIFQPITAVAIFLSFSNPLVFKALTGVDNPSIVLTLWFTILVALVSLNRVLIIRFTKFQLETKSLKKMYLVSSLVFLVSIYPLTTNLGNYGMVLCSIAAESIFLFYLFRSKTIQEHR